MSGEWNYLIESVEGTLINGADKSAKISDDLEALCSQSNDLAALAVARREEMVGDFDQLSRSLEAFHQAVGAEESKWSERAHALTDDFQHWQTAIEDAKHEVLIEMQELESLGSQIGAKLREKQAHCQTVVQQTGEAVRHAHEHAQTQRIASMMSAVKNEFDAMSSALEQTKSRLFGQIESFTSQTGEAERRHQTEFATAIHSFDQRNSEWQKALDELLRSSVAPFQHQLSGEIENRLDRELKELMNKAASYLQTALKDLIDEMAGRAKGAAGERSAIREIIEEVEYFAQNLDRVAKRIAAEAAGNMSASLIGGMVGGPVGMIGGEIIKIGVEEILD